MASVTSLGVGSGLDLESIVTKLMAVEQQPLTALQTKQTSYNTRISSLGSLKSSLAALQTAASALQPSVGQTSTALFSTYSASTASASIATATAQTGAVAGTYTLDNIVLATAQQIRKGGITVPDEAGSLSIQVGTGSAVSVSIAAGSTLSDISDAINDANTGVSAAIINDGEFDHLVLTANDTGEANTITIAGSGTGWTGGAFDYTGTGANNDWLQPGTAQNASLDINGIPVTSASNTLSSSISGVTLNLVASGSTTLTISRDSTTKLTSAINAFVSAYNTANSMMRSLGTYNASTGVAGKLQGDSALRSAQSQVKNLLYSTVAGGTSAYQRLSDIGISLLTDGSLSVDSTKLSTAIAADYSGVASLVAKVGENYDTVLEGIVGTSGTLIAATNSTTSMIKTLTARQEALSSRLTTIEANYRARFSALDTLISSMNSTSTYLTQQLDALASLTSNN